MHSNIYKNDLIMLKKQKGSFFSNFFLVLGCAARSGSFGRSAGWTDFTIKRGE